MDLILHKKLLALQEENALLRKNLQELSDELNPRYRHEFGDRPVDMRRSQED